MKTSLALILALLPAPLLAQSAFDQMVGNWRGNGNYVEGGIGVDLRCRFAITGDRSAIHMAGRCASSLGAEDFTMDFERLADGTAVVRNGQSARAAASKVDTLVGPVGRNGVVVTGTAEGEEITVQLIFNDDGSLVFATREIVGGSKTQSYVTLARQ